LSSTPSPLSTSGQAEDEQLQHHHSSQTTSQFVHSSDGSNAKLKPLGLGRLDGSTSAMTQFSRIAWVTLFVKNVSSQRGERARVHTHEMPFPSVSGSVRERWLLSIRNIAMHRVERTGVDRAQRPTLLCDSIRYRCDRNEYARLWPSRRVRVYMRSGVKLIAAYRACRRGAALVHVPNHKRSARSDQQPHSKRKGSGSRSKISKRSSTLSPASSIFSLPTENSEEAPHVEGT
jgi:hypothetical protein